MQLPACCHLLGKQKTFCLGIFNCVYFIEIRYSCCPGQPENFWVQEICLSWACHVARTSVPPFSRGLHNFPDTPDLGFLVLVSERTHGSIWLLFFKLLHSTVNSCDLLSGLNDKVHLYRGTNPGEEGTHWVTSVLTEISLISHSRNRSKPGQRPLRTEG